MRYFFLFLAVCLLLPFGCSKKADESQSLEPLPKAADVELVKAKTTSFGFGCPTGWEIKEPNGKQKSLNCSGEGSMCFALEEFGTGTLTPKKYWQKAADAQAKVMGPLKIDKEGAHDVGGVRFYRVITNEGIYFAFTDKGRAVTLSCVAMGSNLTEKLPFYDAIAQSFVWK